MEYASSLCETAIRLTQAGVGVIHCVAPGNPFLDMARNGLVEQFMKTEATDLLFIDADVGWDAKTVTRVLSYPQEIVGGLVPKRDHKSDSTYHMNAITGHISVEGLFESIELPTAFVRIKRSGIERMKAAGFGADDKPFFKIGSKKEDFGEDIYFCRRWTELGQKIWVDSDITFTHRGGKAWRGNFFDHCVTTGLYQPKAA